MRNAPLSTSKQTDPLDSALIERIAAGNQRAFETLIRRYYSAMFRFIYHLVHNEDQVNDVLQHVWLQLYLTAPRLHRNQSLRAWLFCVARNRSFDLLRQRPLVHFSELEHTESEGEQTFNEMLLDFSAQPEALAEQNELQRALLLAIEHLPCKQRAVVFLRYTEELSFGEIGQRLGIPMGTAKTYFHRARRHLCQEMAASL